MVRSRDWCGGFHSQVRVAPSPVMHLENRPDRENCVGRPTADRMEGRPNVHSGLEKQRQSASGFAAYGAPAGTELARQHEHHDGWVWVPQLHPSCTPSMGQLERMKREGFILCSHPASPPGLFVVGPISLSHQ